MVDATAGGVSRAAAVLMALGTEEASARGGLGVVRIAEVIGADKGQASRLLKTLAEHGLVERDPDSRVYRLGWQLYALAARAGDQRLLNVAGPVLAGLVRELGERVSLSVLRDADVLTVISDAPPRSVQAVSWVGRTVPAYCTSSGRALLLDHHRDDLSALFADVPFRQLGPNAPRDVDELYERIEASRGRGFAVVDEEFEAGLVAVAAPVRDAQGRISAAVNVSAPRFRLASRTRLQAVGRTLRAAGQELSRLCGGAGSSPEAGGNGTDRMGGRRP